MDHQLRLALVWNGTILLERNFSQTSSPTITIGERLDNHLVIPAPELAPSEEILHRTERGYAFRPLEQYRGTLTLTDRELDLEEVDNRTSEIELTPGEWGTVLLGDDVTIFFQVFDGKDDVAMRSVGDRFEPPVVGSVTISAMLHAAFLLLAHLAFDVDPSLEQMENIDRWIGIAVNDVADPFEPEDETEFEEATGKRAKGEEGKTGTEESEIAEANLAKAEGELVEEFNPRDIGVAHAINTIGPGALRDMLDNTGFDDAMAVAFDGDGTDTDLPRGVGGMSLRGDKRGGGGDTFGRINAIGEIDTGGGRNSGARLKKKEEKKLSELELFEPKVPGEFCEAANIRRVINAKANTLKYCFEKELQSKPDLKGKIVAQWTIDTDGAVQKANVASSTMGDKLVEGCVTRVIKNLKFAQPRGGGMCVIQYPFVFSGID